MFHFTRAKLFLMKRQSVAIQKMMSGIQFFDMEIVDIVDKDYPPGN